MTLQPKRFPSAILFDWDNTLVDTTQDTLRALNAVSTKFGQKTMTLAEFHQKPSLTLRLFIESIVSPEDVLVAEKFFIEHTKNIDVVFLPHAEKLIHWLHARKIPMGIVSNKIGTRLRSEIDTLKLAHVFYCAIGSGDTTEDKPSSKPLLHALSQRQIVPSEDIWFVGDSVVDMMCAYHAGCTPVSVSLQADIYEKPKIKAQDCHGLWTILKNFLPNRGFSKQTQG